MSADEMIACLGSCRARSEIAAMIKALSLHITSPITPLSSSGLPAESARGAGPTVSLDCPRNTDQS
jgi:hypothetical protein